MNEAAVAAFWDDERRQEDATLPPQPPVAWAFGATPEHADELLALVLEGVKTGTASTVWEYEDGGETMPVVGELSIILDGSGEPQAVIRTTALEVVPFDRVGPEHAHSEGEGDRTLASWREAHERYWRAHSTSPRGFAQDMPVLCERFELLWPRPAWAPVRSGHERAGAEEGV